MTKMQINAQIVDEAIDWVIKLDSGNLTQQENEDFASWLKSSPLHIDELLLNASLYIGVQQTKCQLPKELEELLSNADTNVISLINPQSEEATTGNQLGSSIGDRKFTHRAIGLVASIVIAVSIFSINFYDKSESDTVTVNVETMIGESNTLKLADGSQIFVNTGSQVSTKMTNSIREISLHRGEAFFDVASDKKRVFRVLNHSTTIEVTGTKFNVRNSDKGTHVEVLEGSVRVFDNDRSDESIVVLSIGQTAFLPSGSGDPIISNKPVEQMAIWRKRQLLFEATTLEEIAAEFNRYNTSKILIDSPSLRNQTYSGVFSSGEPETFVKILTLQGDIKVNRGPGVIRLRASQ